ncbi:MAG: hypothetical protein J6K20_09115 [Thermoguttaceae bacterium]|nr:hypothetical protein [Thermoguttaceae bacterium]
MPTPDNLAQLSRPLRVDLGFSRWETAKRLRSDAEYDFYLARPRGSRLAPNVILKTTTALTSASVVGAAAVERDRFLGSILSPRLLPTLDFVRPRPLSATRAQRGCVVVPIFSGRTLAARLADGETFASETLDALFTQLASALAALHRVGWVAGELTPARVLLADPIDRGAPSTATLLDFSAARRFELPSLLAKPSVNRFDPDFALPPDVFYAPNASPERDVRALRRFVERLKNASASFVR